MNFKKVVVIGNGPSLKGFDFQSLSHRADSIGLNAAYRHWEQLGWYPTHYVCLDDQVVVSHAEAISDLVLSGKVKSALLVKAILELKPELSSCHNVTFLESLRPSPTAPPLKAGACSDFSKFFFSANSSKVTTGSYAVRYAAYLGYQSITVLGMDLKYQEKIPEAESTEGYGMQILETPSKNPNYYFDGYQTKGDRFNKPNPSLHGDNLHLDAFKTLAYDMAAWRTDSRIYNSSELSPLYQDQILDFITIDDFLNCASPGPARSKLPPETPAFRARIKSRVMREIYILRARLTAWTPPRSRANDDNL
jgi:hypothetical protein